MDFYDMKILILKGESCVECLNINAFVSKTDNFALNNDI